MGGDDLGSDDDFLDTNILSDEGEYGKIGIDSENVPQKKRCRGDAKVERGEESSTKGANRTESRKKKKKLMSEGQSGGVGRKNLLMEAGRGIGGQPANVQAAFLWTCYTHSLGLQGRSSPEDNSQQLAGKFKSSSFVDSSSFCTSKGISAEDRDKNLSSFIKESVSSSKRLKKWKSIASPMVLIVCLSARRCVEVLKAVSSLRVRCAKLFAKHMDLSEQRCMMGETPFGVAVGTPHRLLNLSEGLGDEEAVLGVEHTELILIDCHQDSKGFTVCTLNDTSSVFMQLIHKVIVPEMEKRKTIKFAMY